MPLRYLGRLTLWLLLALTLVVVASAALQFANMLPQCTALCEPPKRCAFVSKKLVCRDGCWTGRCPATQRCVRDKCPDPSTGCTPQAVRCVSPSELRSVSSCHRQCSRGDHASCDRFQQCVPTFPGFLCADICDPKRCPAGFSCQLEPPVDCTAEPCLPVAMCFGPDGKAVH